MALAAVISIGAALAPIPVHGGQPEERIRSELQGSAPAVNGPLPAGAWGVFDDVARWWRQFGRGTTLVVVDVTPLRSQLDDLLRRGGELWQSRRTAFCKSLVWAFFMPIRSQFPLGASRWRAKQLANELIDDHVYFGELPYNLQDKLANFVANQAVNRLLGDPWTDIVRTSKVEVCGV